MGTRIPNQYFGFTKTTLFVVLFVFFLSVFLFVSLRPVKAAPGQITFQGKLTDSSDVTVADGSFDMVIALYDASTAGTCLYISAGSCDSAASTTISVTVTNGLFSVTLGDGSDTNTIDPTIFQTNDVYLGIQVSTDAEMSPRRQLNATGFAYDSMYLSGLATSTTGGTSNYIPAADSSGNFTYTGSPQGQAISQGVLYINPSSATDDYTMLGIAENGTNLFWVDEDGDVFTVGNMQASSTNSSDLGTASVGWKDVYASGTLYLGTSLLPKDNNTVDIGAYGTAVNDIFSSGTIYATTIGSTTNNLTVAASSTFTAQLTAQGHVVIGSSTGEDNLTVVATSTFTGPATFNHNVVIGDANSDNLTIRATSTFVAGITAQDIIPSEDATYILGSAGAQWNGINATGTATMNNLTVHGTCTGCGGAASGWTDTGSILHPDAVTDDIAMGATTSPNAKLHIVPDDDNIGLVVQATSSQSADLTQWLNAASSSKLAYIDSGGGIFGSSTLEVTGVSTLYGDVIIDGQAAQSTNNNPLLLIGTDTKETNDDHTVLIKRAQGVSGAEGQLFIQDGAANRKRLSIGYDDDGSPADSGGIAIIGSYYTTPGQTRTDLELEANWIIIDAHSTAQHTSPTSATPAIMLQDTGTDTTAPILALKKESTERLYVYASDTKRVEFKSNVTDQAGASAFVFNTNNLITSGTDRALFAVQNNHAERFAVSAGGNVYALESFIANTSAGDGFPGDVAEYVHVSPGETLEAGDVIMLDPNNPLHHKKTEAALQSNVAGVVSDSGAFIIGTSDNGRRVPMALAGLVYIKASTESGAIAVGDLLVTASTPGTVMKYDKEKHKGLVTIVGMAMESFEKSEGKVLSHVRNAWLSTEESETTIVQSASGDMVASKTQDIIAKAVKSATGVWEITEDGIMKIKQVEAQTYVVDADSTSPTIGEATVPTGQQSVTVSTTAVSEDSKIFVSFVSNLAGRSYFISEKIPGQSFTVTLSSSASEFTRFDWWIVQKKGGIKNNLGETIVEAPTAESQSVPESVVEEIVTSEEIVVEEVLPDEITAEEGALGDSTGEESFTQIQVEETVLQDSETSVETSFSEQPPQPEVETLDESLIEQTQEKEQAQVPETIEVAEATPSLPTPEVVTEETVVVPAETAPEIAETAPQIVEPQAEEVASEDNVVSNDS